MRTSVPVRRLLGGLAIAMLALSGCAADTHAQRDDESQRIVRGGTLSSGDVRVGDCLISGAEHEVTEVNAVPCSEPHDLVAYHSFTLPAGAFPGDDVVEEEARESCVEAMSTATDSPWQNARVGVTTIHPVRESWTRSRDREVVCLTVAATPEPRARTTSPTPSPSTTPPENRAR